MVGELDAGNPHVQLCVQRRLAYSVGGKPTEARVRRLVAWIAGRRETESLKPIDGIILGMMASHRAATKVNAYVASTVFPRGTSSQPEDEGNMERRNWLKRRPTP